uniref:Uncharacterized protein n=1 Tax=Anopheles culicifacies TaxID=139723 RepID=A0A182M7D3_9DIPT
MNFLRNAGKKVIVEYEGRIYCIPEKDYPHAAQSDRHPTKSYDKHEESGAVQHDHYKSKPDGCNVAKVDTDRVLSDTLSELSDSNMFDDLHTSKVTNPVNPLVSSSAAKVLSELKEEVTRLIDESILKIEHEWVESKRESNDGTCEAVPPVATMDTAKCAEEPSNNLHPDGDRSQLTHREQNLQVLHTEIFRTNKRLTRMKLLNEIRELVERLKDLETLEE